MRPRKRKLGDRLQGWQKTWATIVGTCTARGLRKNIVRADPRGRTVFKVLDDLRELGADIQPNIVTQLDDDGHAFEPRLTVEHMDFMLSHFAFDCGKDYTSETSGWGGVSSGNKHSDKVVFQFGGDIDCGFREDLDTALAAMQARRDREDVRQGDHERALLQVLERFLRWLRAEEKKLESEGKMKACVAHLAIYRKGGSMKVHLDIRLDSSLSRRALYPIRPNDCSDVNAERLTFYAGFARNGVTSFQEDAPRFTSLELGTAICLGRAGGIILLTGVGAGGFWLIPPGQIQEHGANGRALFVWHEPHATIEGEGSRATFCISGKAVE